MIRNVAEMYASLFELIATLDEFLWKDVMAPILKRVIDRYFHHLLTIWPVCGYTIIIMIIIGARMVVHLE